jgi:ADP-L-glycero-D-manno-heptose 6-epimerase
MIILTGGAGFIGTNTLIGLNESGEEAIVVVDDIGTSPKWQHLVGRRFYNYVQKDRFWSWLEAHPSLTLRGVVHLGACTDTTERDFDYLIQNNVHYSQQLWRLCVERQVPFIYASSAATYGEGLQGFADEHDRLRDLQPVSAYGFSKHLFDLWAMQQKESPPRWAGLKFFNVYGSYEEHKGQMASMVYHGFRQVREKSYIRLFKSHRSEYKHGEQRRDFISVKDVVAIIHHFLYANTPSGVYNVGTGQARSFNDLATAVFAALGKPVKIEYMDMPEELRSQYQYFTRAAVDKLRNAGFGGAFTPLEEGVVEYVGFLSRQC